MAVGFLTEVLAAFSAENVYLDTVFLILNSAVVVFVAMDLAGLAFKGSSRGFNYFCMGISCCTFLASAAVEVVVWCLEKRFAASVANDFDLGMGVLIFDPAVVEAVSVNSLRLSWERFCKLVGAYSSTP